MRPREAVVSILPIVLIAVALSCVGPPRGEAPELDPAAWGADHVREPLMDFVSGDECLFCHRDIGASWSSSWHQKTIRHSGSEAAALAALFAREGTRALAEKVDLVLGGARQLRFLRRGEAYGQLELLEAVSWSPPREGGEGRLVNAEASRPGWDPEVFGRSCSGCHATAVDARSGALSAISLDCFVCHGDVSLEHSDSGRVALLGSGDTPARVVISICGQCHLRSGRSRHSGRPYATHFVPGDNLFRDYQIDWSDEHLRSLEAIDRHIFENTRDVVVRGRTTTTCLSCHRVHRSSTREHYHLAADASCDTCHESGVGAIKWPLQTHSRVCGYQAISES